jgi:hypothetical protein
MGCILLQVSVPFGLDIAVIRAGVGWHLLLLFIELIFIIIGVIDIGVSILEIILFILDV